MLGLFMNRLSHSALSYDCCLLSLIFSLLLACVLLLFCARVFGLQFYAAASASLCALHSSHSYLIYILIYTGYVIDLRRPHSRNTSTQ